MSDEPSVQVKEAIIKQELVQVRAEMYRLGLRHAVQESLGRKQKCEEIEKDMENIHAAVLIYEEELQKVLGDEEGEECQQEV